MDAKCQVCGTVLDPGGVGVRICPTCKAGAHEECWSHLGGCVSPECRKAMRQAERESKRSFGDRRRSALLRRRLGWIVAHEMRIVSEFHPDEVRLRVGAVVCAVLAAVAAWAGHGMVAKVFGGCALVVCVLLLSHRQERAAGKIHRWIPAEAAPESGVKIADWLLVLEGSGEGGVGLEDFGRESIEDREDRLLFEEVCRAGYLQVRGEGEGRVVHLDPRAEPLLEEARSRPGQFTDESGEWSQAG